MLSKFPGPWVRGPWLAKKNMSKFGRPVRDDPVDQENFYQKILPINYFHNSVTRFTKRKGREGERMKNVLLQPTVIKIKGTL